MLKYSIITLFACGLLSPLNFRLGGDIFFPDLFLIGSFLFMGRRLGKLPGARYLVTITILGCLWFLSQVITDIYRETPFEDWSRGWAKILFFLLDLLGLAVVTRLRLERIMAFSAGASIAMILQTLFFPNDFQADNGAGDFAGGPWKFGLGPGLTSLAAVFGATSLSKSIFSGWGEFAPLSIMGVMNLAFNSRSGFGMAMAAVAYGALKRHIDMFPGLRRSMGPSAFLALGFGAFVFVQALIGVYSVAAANNWLGDAARENTERKTSGDVSLIQAGTPGISRFRPKRSPTRRSSVMDPGPRT